MSKNLRNKIKKILSEEIKNQEKKLLSEVGYLGPAMGGLGSMGTAAGAAALGGAGLATGGAALVAAAAAGAIYATADEWLAFTPAQTTVKVLTPGANGLVRGFNKKLDKKIKSIYSSQGIEFDQNTIYDIETVIPDKSIGLSSTELPRIAQALDDAIETPGMLNVGTDEEAITKALQSCKSQWGVSQVSEYYSKVFGGSLQEKLYSDLSHSDFLKYVTGPIDSMPLITLDGSPFTEQDFFMMLSSQINAAEKEVEKAKESSGEDEGLEADRNAQVNDDDGSTDDDDDDQTPYVRRPLSDMKVIISDVPFNQKTYTLDQIFGEGAALEMAGKIYDTFTDDALINGINTKKLNFAIKFRNGKARSGKAQLRGRKGMQGVFASQTNVKAQIVRWFKQNKREATIREFKKLDGIIRGSVYIPGGMY